MKVYYLLLIIDYFTWHKSVQYTDKERKKNKKKQFTQSISRHCI